MNRVLRCLSLVAVLAILGINYSKAQVDFSFHAGLVSPLASFADSRASNGQIAWMEKTGRAGAGLGFEAGMKFRYGIPSIQGLGVIVTADLFYNGPNTDVKDFWQDQADEMFDNSNVEDVEITLPKYVNLPIMIGANYNHQLSNSVKVYGEGALGLNIGMLTNFRQQIIGDNIEKITGVNYETNTSFAFQIGAGVLFSDRFSLGVYYYALGNQKIKGKYSEEEIYYGDSYVDEDMLNLRSINPTMFVVKAGFHF
ncbi:MAG: hypothetical protein U0L54_03745 [Bacteroidales bacterium]|nr:hypothetical protein [Bacteroidales bacterium]